MRSTLFLIIAILSGSANASLNEQCTIAKAMFNDLQSVIVATTEAAKAPGSKHLRDGAVAPATFEKWAKANFLVQIDQIQAKYAPHQEHGGIPPLLMGNVMQAFASAHYTLILTYIHVKDDSYLTDLDSLQVEIDNNHKNLLAQCPD